MTTQDLELEVDFGQQGNSALFCGPGWSGLEPDERWALGFESRLTIPAPSTPGDYFLVLKLRPLVAPGRIGGQRLYVSINGAIVAEFFTTERSSRACRLPWGLLAGHRNLEIIFRTPDAASPATYAAGGDDRVLAVALSSLVLFRDRHTRPEALGITDAFPALPTNRTSSRIAERPATRELMLRFESLGQNCEFGLVQRRCKVEPLGLLRFASTPLSNLLAAFDGNFEGFGSPDAIEIFPSENRTEYMVGTRYGLIYHAWVKIEEMTAEEVHRREARRVPMLVRKLLQDLRSADKIFVFRGMAAVPEEQVMPLYAAVRRFGPNTLLFVTLADAAHPSGTVETRLPGFLVGYIERFAPSEDAHDLLLDEWITICRNAHAMRVTPDR